MFSGVNVANKCRFRTFWEIAGVTRRARGGWIPEKGSCCKRLSVLC